MSTRAEKAIYDVDDVLQFGKHKGKKMSDVIEDDVHWVKWALENIQWFDVTPAAERLINACKEPYKKYPDADDDGDDD